VALSEGNTLRQSVSVALGTNVIKSGYFKLQGLNKYLHCDDDTCTFVNGASDATWFEVPSYSAQVQSMMKVSSSNKCLQRDDCFKGTSKAKLNTCDTIVCGQVHWQYNPQNGRLAEDWSQNCINDFGSIEHCVNSDASKLDFCELEGATYTGEWQFIGDGMSTSQTFSYSETASSAVSEENSVSKTRGLTLEYKGASFTHSQSKAASSNLAHTLSATVKDQCSVNFQSGPRYRWIWKYESSCSDKIDIPTCVFLQPADGKEPCCPPDTFAPGSTTKCVKNIKSICS